MLIQKTFIGNWVGEWLFKQNQSSHWGAKLPFAESISLMGVRMNSRVTFHRLSSEPPLIITLVGYFLKYFGKVLLCTFLKYIILWWLSIPIPFWLSSAEREKRKKKKNTHTHTVITALLRPRSHTTQLAHLKCSSQGLPWWSCDPVVKTQCSQSRECGFDCWLRN